MGVEIERRFLIDKKKWQAIPKPEGKHIRQGYIITEPEKTIRIRLTSDECFLNIKGKTTGMVRSEYEYPIPLKDGKELLKNFASSEVEKIRFKIKFKNKDWDVDEFLGENEGLILAEIELKNKNEIFKIPEWVSVEVTDDERYYNANLAQNPYRNWKPDDEKTASLNIPAEIIKEIAGYLEAGLCCFLNRKTFELVSIPDSNRFHEMDWDNGENEWADDIKKVSSNPDFIEIKFMDSTESFEVMEDFVCSLPEGKVKTQLDTVLGGHKPFANFNHIIHQAGKEREQWFKFRTGRTKKWVMEQLEGEF